MNQQQILNELKEIITPYLDTPCEIEMYTDLFKDLAINSIDFANIIAEVEDTFYCNVSDDEMFTIHVVSDIVEIIMES